MNIASNQRFVVSKDVLFQDVSGEIVLLDLASEQYFGLDEVGARIWAFVTDGATLEEIVDSVFNEYDVDRETAQSDVRGLLGQLLEAGLVRVERSGNGDRAE